MAVNKKNDQFFEEIAMYSLGVAFIFGILFVIVNYSDGRTDTLSVNEKSVAIATAVFSILYVGVFIYRTNTIPYRTFRLLMAFTLLALSIYLVDMVFIKSTITEETSDIFTYLRFLASFAILGAAIEVFRFVMTMFGSRGKGTVRDVGDLKTFR